MTCVIVEDEFLLAKVLEKMLKEEGVDVLGCAHSGKEAVILIEKLQPDFVLLDINLGDLTGFDILQRLKYRPYIVFTTAYSEYAVKAFEENALDYILKPVKKERLKSAIDKVRIAKEEKEAYLTKIQQFDRLMEVLKMMGESIIRESEGYFKDKLPIETASEIIFIRFEEIIYIEADGKNTIIVLWDDKREVKKITRHPLKDIEAKLPKSEFIRVHKSFVVSTRHIKKILKNYFGRLAIEMQNGEIIPVSRHYRENLMKLTGINEG
ncbi:MAG: LytR/AlgR family response regulator transcription factor [Fervidobacterium sp.]